MGPVAAMALASAVPAAVGAVGGGISNLATRKQFKRLQNAQAKEWDAYNKGELGLTASQRRKMLGQTSAAIRADQRTAPSTEPAQSGYALETEQQKRNARAMGVAAAAQGADAMSQAQAEQRKAALLRREDELLGMRQQRIGSVLSPLTQGAMQGGAMYGQHVMQQSTEQARAAQLDRYLSAIQAAGG